MVVVCSNFISEWWWSGRELNWDYGNYVAICQITEFIKAIMRIAKFNETTPALVSWILQENNNGQQMSSTAYFKTIFSLKTRTSGTSHH